MNIKNLLILLFLIVSIENISQNVARTEYIHVYLGDFTEDETDLYDLIEAPHRKVYNHFNKIVSFTLFRDSIDGPPYEEFKYYYINDTVLDYVYRSNGFDRIKSINYYHYDSDGTLKELRTCDKDRKNCTYKVTYQYDERKNLIKEESLRNGEFSYLETYEHIYKRNKIIKTTHKEFQKNKTLVCHKEKTFKKNILVKSEDKVKNLITNYYYYYYYNKDKTVKYESRTRDGKTSILKIKYKYDSKGNLIFQAMNEESGFGEMTFIKIIY